MKKLMNLKGAKILSKNEQQSVKGGKIACGRYGGTCPTGYCCTGTYCVPVGGGINCYPEILP